MERRTFPLHGRHSAARLRRIRASSPEARTSPVRLEAPNRVVISAEVATEDAAGAVHATRIIAVLVALDAPGAPGFMDYVDDACSVSAAAIVYLALAAPTASAGTDDRH